MIEIATELIRLIPSLLWFGLIAVLLILFYKPIRDDLIPNLSGLKAMGVELSFVKNSLDAAIELAEKSPQWKVEVSVRDKERALNRVRKHLKLFKNVQILWIDDSPENNKNEQRMFRKLGVEFDIARSTQEALAKLKKTDYDIIFSDMARNSEATAGLAFLKEFRKLNKKTPVIFYVGVIDPKKGVPAQAFGITNRPDQLLHLALDALERTKYE